MSLPNDPQKRESFLAHLRANAAKMRGVPKSPGHNELNRLAHLGKPNPGVSAWMTENNPMRRAEAVAKLSKTRTGRNYPKLSVAQLGVIRGPHDATAKIAQREKYRKRLGVRVLRCEIAEFREQVLDRDKRTCQHCGITESDWKQKQIARGKKVIHGLDVHHIKSRTEYPELIIEPSNATTLCNPCHKKEEHRINPGNRFLGRVTK